jgi:hypothetical protein
MTGRPAPSRFFNQNQITMEDQINKLINRLENVDREIALVDMIDKEITKTTFHSRARQFITSLLKQRQLIIDRGASHKNVYEMLKIIDHLKVNLDAAGMKDLSMSKFFLINEVDIRSLIPGSYPNKIYEKFIALRDQAREIKNRN